QPATASYTLAAQGKLSPIRKRVEANPECFYIAALNTKNAIKKIRRIALNGFLLFPNANPEIITP
ncbi:MAG TPA: hypothetical protein VEA37_10150, partial [Flavobacterium sp.]|nr:hypothetical protein [Flavobacterium sp.]